jgi:anti-sigma B factor antagonist
MAALSPVDTVRELCERLERDGVEAALELVDEDVVYLLQLGGGRVLRGSGEVLAELTRAGVSVEARLDTLEARGDAVMASGTVRLHHPDGLHEGRYHWVFHFDGGRLRRLSIYAERQDALASLAALDAIAPPPEFAVEERQDAGGVVTLRPTGELDIGTAERFQRALVEGRSAGDRVVLDLAQLEFIDSTGLRTIVHAIEVARRDRCELRLRRGPRAVHRVFEISGVADALPFDTS